MNIIILGQDKNIINKVYHKCFETYDFFNELPIMSKEDILSNSELVKDVRFIFSTWGMPSFEKEEIQMFFPHLEAIFYAAGTIESFENNFNQCGIKIFSARDINGISVAEFTVAQIVLANKGYFQSQKKFNKLLSFSMKKAKKYSEIRTGNFESNIGIIGAGVIGKQVIHLLQNYQNKIYVYDPYVSYEQIENNNVVKVNSLKEIFQKCDIISNHLPDTPSTRGILDKSVFLYMKDTATFINTGRGKQVNENDLADVLRLKPYACALLDVTAHEPLAPWSKLRRLNNVFVSPHIAGSTGNELWRMGISIVETYCEYLDKIKNIQ